MKYQHNFTTKEQALRLKAAGLPAESADCLLSRMDADYGINDLVTLISEKGEAGENWDYFMDEDAYPCWSLGRLIELATKMLEHVWEVTQSRPLFLKMEYTADMVEDAIRWFERCKDRKEFDFSILLPDKPQPKPEPQKVENCFIRPFHSRCPLDPKMEVDIYNCTDCPHYFCTSTKSIICKYNGKN